MNGPLARWRQRRRQATEARILMALLGAGRPLAGLEICQAAGLRSGTIHPALARMERDGRITSDWDAPRAAGAPPRRRYQPTAPEDSP